MKNVLNIFLWSVLVVGLFSCKKDESRVYYEGNKSDISLSSPETTPLVLLKDNSSDIAMTLNWNNPEYMFSTGASTQKVTYTIQVDAADGDFSKPQSKVVTDDVKTTLTVGELNAFLLSMEATPEVEKEIQIRVIGALANSVTSVTSNIIKRKLTPYENVVITQMYVPGDYQKFAPYAAALPAGNDYGWEPSVAPKLGSTNSDTYNGYIYVPAGGSNEFKITSGPDWSVGYGGTATTLDPDGGNLVWPGPHTNSAGGTVYYVTAKKSALTWSAKPVKFMIAGDFNGWDNSATEMTYTTGSQVFTYTTNFVAGGFKIIIDGTWSGGNGTGSLLIGGGDNIPITAGTHTVTVDMSNPPSYKVSVQ